MDLNQHTQALMNSAVSEHSGGDNQAFFYIDGIPTKGKWFDLEQIDGWEDVEQQLGDLFGCEVDEVLCADVEGLAKHFYASSCDSFDMTEWLEFKEAKECTHLDDEVIDAYLDNYGCSCAIDDIEEAYQGAYDSDEDFAYDLMEQTGGLDSIPENLRCYFDYEEFARDLMTCDYFSSNGHYFRNL